MARSRWANSIIITPAAGASNDPHTLTLLDHAPTLRFHPNKKGSQPGLRVIRRLILEKYSEMKKAGHKSAHSIKALAWSLAALGSQHGVDLALIVQ